VFWSALDGNANPIVGTSGSTVGSPTPTTDKNGNPGGAVQFDGSSYFSIPKQVNSLTAGTMSFWARADSVAGETGPVAVGASGGGPAQYFVVQNESAATARWRADVDDGADAASGTTGAGRLDVFSNDATPVGAWQHVVATFATGGNLRLYVDGVAQNDVQSLATTNQTIVPTNDWLIGAERAGERRWVGAVDDVRIYDNELTQQEVTALFNAGPTFVPEPSACGLVALGCLALGARRRRPFNA
jgi:hypothetical protein